MAAGKIRGLVGRSCEGGCCVRGRVCRPARCPCPGCVVEHPRLLHEPALPARATTDSQVADPVAVRGVVPCIDDHVRRRRAMRATGGVLPLISQANGGEQKGSWRDGHPSRQAVQNARTLERDARRLKNRAVCCTPCSPSALDARTSAGAVRREGWNLSAPAAFPPPGVLAHGLNSYPVQSRDSTRASLNTLLRTDRDFELHVTTRCW